MSLSPIGTPPIPPQKPAQKPVAITGPLSIGDLLDRVFRFLRARFGVLMLTASSVLIPIGVLSALLTGRFMTGYWELIEFSATADDFAESDLPVLFGNMATLFGGVALIAIFTMLGTSVISLATTFHVERFLHGAPSTVAEGLRAALRRFWPMLGMQIVQALAIGLATIIIMIAIGILLFAAIAAFGLLSALTFNADQGIFSMILVVVAVVAAVVGYVAFIILAMTPAAYLSARWVAAAPAIMLEQQGPVAALKRSWRLSKGHIWRCIGFVVLLTLFSSLVIGLPLSMAQQMAMVFMPAQISLVAMLGTIAGYVASILYQPIYATGVALLYFDLRVRAEAYDVALRVAALEAEVAQDGPTT
jgi:hypothetical protein